MKLPPKLLISTLYVRALVADRDMGHQLAARRCLEDMGVQTDGATDGQLALALSQAIQYDLIFIDGALLKGIADLSALRSLEVEGRLISIVVMTDSAEPAGDADEYLSKPLSTGQIEKAVNVWAARRARTTTS